MSSLKPDENLVFFDTAAAVDSAPNAWQIPLHAWVYEPEDSLIRKRAIAEVLDRAYGLRVTDATRENFARRINLFLVDNERNKDIVVRVAGQLATLPPTQPNGHTYHSITLNQQAAAAASTDGVITFSADLKAPDKRRFEGRVHLVEPEGISVISDIDDTVKVTHVTDKARMFESTFYRDFEAVPGMAQVYRAWAERGAVIHFVSSSPWQLYQPLTEFLRAEGFPFVTLSLKHVRFKDSSFFDLFKSGEETKPRQIEPLLSAYPARKFILVGDSGEQDPETYSDVYRRWPNQILRIYIRNVTGARRDDSRFSRIFDGIPSSTWQLFEDPKTLVPPEIASH